MKLLLAYLHYGPYHHARLAEVREKSLARGITVTGLEMARTQGEYAWSGAAHEDLVCASPENPLEEVSGKDWSTLLGPPLERVEPDLCAIAGYSHPAMLALISLCAERGIPWILMSDSQEIDEIRRFWLEWTKSRIVKLASAGLVAGRPHLDYLNRLGMPGDRLFTGYDVVDNAYFAREAAKWRSGPDAAPPYFLASARFIPKKNLHRLLEAYARYAEPKSEIRNRGAGPTQSEMPHAWSLCLLGNGELKGDLLAHAQSLDLTVIECAPWELQTKNEAPGTKNEEPSGPPTIFLPGFRQIDELPRFYAAAGAFVHASTTEQWGLVVNEAMACGLPVLVSDRCGCASDLVSDGENGWTFDPTDVGALANLMSRIAALPEGERKELGEVSERLIANWGPERFASGLFDAANCAVAVGPKRAGWLDRLLLKALARR